MTPAPTLLPSEWRAIFRDYLIRLVVVAVMLFMAGFQCARVMGHRDVNRVVAKEEDRQHTLETVLRASEKKRDSMGVTISVLRSALAVDSTNGAVLHAASIRREAAITIKPVALLPLDDSLRTADTVRYADVQRPNDERHYAVPKFFTDSYIALRMDRNGTRQVALDQQEVIGALMAKSIVTDSSQALADSLNASLSREVVALHNQGHPWCGWRCGSIGTLAVLTAAAITLHEVRR